MNRLEAWRARTRERLLDAAQEVMAEKGIEGARLDEIAARAGLTKGAIYDHFDSKEGLIMAVITSRAAQPRIPKFEPGSTLKAKMREIGRSVAAFIPAAEAQGAASAELELYALNHEAMRSRLIAFYAMRINAAEAMLTGFAREHALPMPPAQFAVMLSVVAAGLIQHRIWAPEPITEDFVIRAFEALVPDEPA
jgi:AcrR family transcriptional regulator